jgi:hypothetical protein
VLIEPPYTPKFAADEHYTRLVAAIHEIAQSHDVPVMLRYEASRFLSMQKAQAGESHFRLRDLMRRCLPEYVARTIVLSLQEPYGSPPARSETDRNLPDARPAR